MTRTDLSARAWQLSRGAGGAASQGRRAIVDLRLWL